MDKTPDPLKDWEPTEPFAPSWLDKLLDVPPLAAATVIVAVIAFLVVTAK